MTPAQEKALHDALDRLAGELATLRSCFGGYGRTSNPTPQKVLPRKSCPSRRCDWHIRANLWRKATSPTRGAKRLRNRTANDGYSDEKMCPMSRKTRIRRPLP